MSAHVLLNLLNELRKKEIKCEACQIPLVVKILQPNISGANLQACCSLVSKLLRLDYTAPLQVFFTK